MLYANVQVIEWCRESVCVCEWCARGENGFTEPTMCAYIHVHMTTECVSLFDSCTLRERDSTQ